jgi:hypothetical protein
MDPASEQLMRALLDGVDQGTVKAVTLGTSAAAAAAWHRARSILRRRHLSPDAEELAVLSAEPGQEVDAGTLRRLLELLFPAERQASIEVHGDYVAHDKNITIHGDYIGCDKRLF